jgi:hypothetical protein
LRVDVHNFLRVPRKDVTPIQQSRRLPKIGQVLNVEQQFNFKEGFLLLLSYLILSVVVDDVAAVVKSAAFAVVFAAALAPREVEVTLPAAALPDGGFLRQILTILADLKVVWQVPNFWRISGGYDQFCTGLFLSGRSGGILAVF